MELENVAARITAAYIIRGDKQPQTAKEAASFYFDCLDALEEAAKKREPQPAEPKGSVKEWLDGAFKKPPS